MIEATVQRRFLQKQRLMHAPVSTNERREWRKIAFFIRRAVGPGETEQQRCHTKKTINEIYYLINVVNLTGIVRSERISSWNLNV